jgi:hypothetical protein
MLVSFHFSRIVLPSRTKWVAAVAKKLKTLLIGLNAASRPHSQVIHITSLNIKDWAE